MRQDTTAPRDYIKSIGVALDKIDKGSTAEQDYLLEKIIALCRWYERVYGSKLFSSVWDGVRK